MTHNEIAPWEITPEQNNLLDSDQNEFDCPNEAREFRSELEDDGTFPKGSLCIRSGEDRFGHSIYFLEVK